MKIPRRTVTLAFILAVVACALVLTMRSFAQPGPYDINLPANGQKLKAPYDDNADLWEKDILKKHAKKYCITHRKKNGESSKHCPKSEAAASQSLIVPVGNSSAPAVMDNTRTGANVTQQISCASQTDQDAITATFDTTP